MPALLLAHLRRKLDDWRDLGDIGISQMSPNQPDFHYGLDIYRSEESTTLMSRVSV